VSAEKSVQTVCFVAFKFALGALSDLKIVHILANRTIVSLPYWIDERVRTNENT
jgi:hypothetical protein